MKLKSFNAHNAASSKYSRLPSVNIGYTSGIIYFNESAKQLTNIKAGDKIEFLQDEDNPKDWYLAKSENGFEVRDKKKSKGVLVQSSKIVKELLHSIDVYKPATMRIAEAIPFDGRKLFPIITKSAK